MYDINKKTAGSNSDPALRRCKNTVFVGRGGVYTTPITKLVLMDVLSKKLTNGKNNGGIKFRSRPTKMQKYGFCRAWWGSRPEAKPNGSPRRCYGFRILRSPRRSGGRLVMTK